LSQSSPNNKNKSALITTPEDLTAAEADRGSKPVGSQYSDLVCPKCGASKVEKSRSKSLDALLMRFIPRRPYRCMRCFHRFWHREKFFADPRRTKSWALLLIVSLIFVAFKTQFFIGIGSDSASSSNSAVADASKLVTENGNSVEASSVVNITGEPFRQALNTGGSLSNKAEKDIIENFAFNAASSANAMDKPQDLSVEEMKRRLAQAKAQVEAAESFSKQKVENLVAEVNGKPEELRSLARIDINYRIEQWRQAWQSGSIESYLKNYSQDFIPSGGLSLLAWQEGRRAKVSPNRQIELELANFDVSFSIDNLSSTVTFDLSYQSKDYREQLRKKLVLNKQGDQWYIVSEAQMN